MFQVQNYGESAATVNYQLGVAEIKEKSVIFSNSSESQKHYHDKMNESSFLLCLERPELLQNKGKLLELCRQKLDNDGFTYKKRNSRSKAFGSHGDGSEKGVKRQKMSANIRAKCKKQLMDEIASLENRIHLMEKQNTRETQMKQFMKAAHLEEEILNLRRQKNLKDDELASMKEKDRKASWYSKKKESTATTSTKTYTVTDSPMLKFLAD